VAACADLAARAGHGAAALEPRPVLGDEPMILRLTPTTAALGRDGGLAVPREASASRTLDDRCVGGCGPEDGGPARPSC
jgi:hypothetical protein